MFGCVVRKNVFRTSVKRDYCARIIDIICHAPNKDICVVFSGRFIYFVHDNTIQVCSVYSTVTVVRT